MGYNLSAQEKRLLIVLVTLIAFAVWYKLFWENLWPRYRILLAEQQELAAIARELPETRARVYQEEMFLSQLKEHNKVLKNRFVPGSGLLVHTIGRLAEGKVTLRRMEPEGSRQEEYCRVNSLRVICEGTYSDILRFLELLEEQTGIRVVSLDLKAGPGANVLLEASLLLEHYLVNRDEPVQARMAGLLYESYIPVNPFIPDQPETMEAGEEPVSEEPPASPDVSKEEWSPVSYTFPVR